MEIEIYTNDGENTETKILCLGSALKYSKNVEDIIENYNIKCDLNVHNSITLTYIAVMRVS